MDLASMVQSTKNYNESIFIAEFSNGMAVGYERMVKGQNSSLVNLDTLVGKTTPSQKKSEIVYKMLSQRNPSEPPQERIYSGTNLNSGNTTLFSQEAQSFFEGYVEQQRWDHSEVYANILQPLEFAEAEFREKGDAMALPILGGVSLLWPVIGLPSYLLVKSDPSMVTAGIGIPFAFAAYAPQMFAETVRDAMKMHPACGIANKEVLGLEPNEKSVGLEFHGGKETIDCFESIHLHFPGGAVLEGGVLQSLHRNKHEELEHFLPVGNQFLQQVSSDALCIQERTGAYFEMIGASSIDHFLFLQQMGFIGGEHNGHYRTA